MSYPQFERSFSEANAMMLMGVSQSYDFVNNLSRSLSAKALSLRPRTREGVCGVGIRPPFFEYQIAHQQKMLVNREMMERKASPGASQYPPLARIKNAGRAHARRQRARGIGYFAAQQCSNRNTDTRFFVAISWLTSSA